MSKGSCMHARIKSSQGCLVGFHSNHSVPTPMTSQHIFMDKWVEHATTQHAMGNSRHHEVLGLALWILVNNMQRIKKMGAQGVFTSLAWLLVTLVGKASTSVGDLMGDASLFTLPT